MTVAQQEAMDSVAHMNSQEIRELVLILKNELKHGEKHILGKKLVKKSKVTIK